MDSVQSSACSTPLARRRSRRTPLSSRTRRRRRNSYPSNQIKRLRPNFNVTVSHSPVAGASFSDSPDSANANPLAPGHDHVVADDGHGSDGFDPPADNDDYVAAVASPLSPGGHCCPCKACVCPCHQTAPADAVSSSVLVDPIHNAGSSSSVYSPPAVVSVDDDTDTDTETIPDSEGIARSASNSSSESASSLSACSTTSSASLLSTTSSHDDGSVDTDVIVPVERVDSIEWVMNFPRTSARKATQRVQAIEFMASAITSTLQAMDAAVLLKVFEAIGLGSRHVDACDTTLLSILIGVLQRVVLSCALKSRRYVTRPPAAFAMMARLVLSGVGQRAIDELARWGVCAPHHSWSTIRNVADDLSCYAEISSRLGIDPRVCMWPPTPTEALQPKQDVDPPVFIFHFDNAQRMTGKTNPLNQTTADWFGDKEVASDLPKGIEENPFVWTSVFAAETGICADALKDPKNKPSAWLREGAQIIVRQAHNPVPRMEQRECVFHLTATERTAMEAYMEAEDARCKDILQCSRTNLKSPATENIKELGAEVPRVRMYTTDPIPGNPGCIEVGKIALERITSMRPKAWQFQIVIVDMGVCHHWMNKFQGDILFLPDLGHVLQWVTTHLRVR